MEQNEKEYISPEDQDNGKEKKRVEEESNAAVAGAASDTVQRFGSAVKGHFVAYSGQDNENGKELGKSLKGLAKEKVNSEYHDQNIKQQAGYAAEVLSAAKDNEENAISGKENTVVRTDDMQKQSDGKGNSIGGKNDPLYDKAEVDKNGVYVEGTGRQLKFVGSTPEKCTSSLLQKKFDKYRDADIEIEIPSDFYDDVFKNLSEKEANLEKQLERAQKDGKTELADKLKERLERVKKTKKLLRRSKISNKDAVFARKHPKLATTKNIAIVANKAGVEAAKEGAVAGGVVSIIRNIVSVVRGDEEYDDAVKNVAKDTGTALAAGYVTGAAGAAIKGAWQNAKSGVLRAAAKNTNFSATVVTTAMSTGETVSRFFKGEIDGVECLEDLGENGATMIASSLGTVIGQVAIPVPVVGAVIGSMVGYTIASASYGVLTKALDDARLAKEERIRIEDECYQHIALIQSYRAELEESISEYLVSYTCIFHTSFDAMKSALAIGDIDGFISGANVISRALGREPQFDTMDEFEKLMKSPIPIRI